MYRAPFFFHPDPANLTLCHPDRKQPLDLSATVEYALHTNTYQERLSEVIWEIPLYNPLLSISPDNLISRKPVKAARNLHR